MCTPLCLCMWVMASEKNERGKLTSSSISFATLGTKDM